MEVFFLNCSLIFWINFVPTPRIERATIDGSGRSDVVTSGLSRPSCVAVDIAQDILFWGDSTLGRIERANLDGSNRVLLREREGLVNPVALAPLGDFLYWADAGDRGDPDPTANRDVIFRMNKLTGDGAEVVKRHVKHLSALSSVSSYPDFSASPCYGNRCSHLCLSDASSSGSKAVCSCPPGTGLVLNADDETCGLPPTCAPDEFSCASRSPACIPLQWRCDGVIECHDASDEIDCPDCFSPGQFLCRNGDCVNATLLCDGKRDCKDNTDEVSDMTT